MAKHCCRGNIFVKQAGGGVYLYTQSRGDKLPKILKDALIRGRSKWGNTAVMTRIIFGEMVQSDVMNLDGFAISTQLADNDFYLLIVDDAFERIGIFNESGQFIRKYSYEDLIAFPDSKLDWLNLSGGMRPETHDYENNLPIASKPGVDPYHFPEDVLKIGKIGSGGKFQQALNVNLEQALRDVNPYVNFGLEATINEARIRNNAAQAQVVPRAPVGVAGTVAPAQVAPILVVGEGRVTFAPPDNPNPGLGEVAVAFPPITPDRE